LGGEEAEVGPANCPQAAALVEAFITVYLRMLAELVLVGKVFSEVPQVTIVVVFLEFLVDLEEVVQQEVVRVAALTEEELEVPVHSVQLFLVYFLLGVVAGHPNLWVVKIELEERVELAVEAQVLLQQLTLQLSRGVMVFLEQVVEGVVEVWEAVGEREL
jgi:hypothetical protein